MGVAVKMVGLFGGKRYAQVFVALPLVVWVAVISFGMYNFQGKRKAPRNPAELFEWCFRRFGTLFPFIVFGLRLAASKWSVVELPAKFWRFSQVVGSIYLGLTALRVVIFMSLPKDTMSDHIFLSLSVSAMLQMEACFALEVWSPKPEKKKQKKAGKIAWAKDHLLLVVVAMNLFIMLLL